MVFLHNCWYVACWSDELKDTPLGRRILNEPAVMYRFIEDKVVARSDSSGKTSTNTTAMVRQ
jgi:vanillate O-demethylase monooxygenase subunit